MGEPSSFSIEGFRDWNREEPIEPLGEGAEGWRLVPVLFGKLLSDKLFNKAGLGETFMELGIS